MDLNDVLEGEMEKCTRYEVYSNPRERRLLIFSRLFKDLSSSSSSSSKYPETRGVGLGRVSSLLRGWAHFLTHALFAIDMLQRKFLKDADCNRLCDRNIGQIPHSYFAKIMTDKHCELPPGLLRKGSDAMMTEISFKLTPRQAVIKAGIAGTMGFLHLSSSHHVHDRDSNSR